MEEGNFILKTRPRDGYTICFKVDSNEIRQKSELIDNYLSIGEAKSIQLDVDGDILMHLLPFLTNPERIELRCTDQSKKSFIEALEIADYLLVVPEITRILVTLTREYLEKKKIPYFDNLSIRDCIGKLKDPRYITDQEREYLKRAAKYGHWRQGKSKK